MTEEQLISRLRDEGFSAGDMFSIIAYFVTNVDKITVKSIQNALPTIKQELRWVKQAEEKVIEGLFES